MKILNVLASLNEEYGGPPQVALSLGQSLNKLNIDINYCATTISTNAFNNLKNQPNTKIFPIKPPYSWFFSPELKKYLQQRIKDFDLLHIHEIWSYPQYISSKLSSRNQIPFIIIPHGELQNSHLNNSFFKYYKKSAYLAILGKNILQNANCIHAISKNEVHGIRAIGYQGPITLIPNGIASDFADHLPPCDEAEEYWPNLHDRRVFLFLSRLSPEKGLNALIPAWAQVIQHSSLQDVVLVLAGPDDRGYRKHVEGLVERYNTGASVLFTGMVKGHQKMALISRSDGYVLPSYSEGFSISILENLAAGKPVVITPGCNFPEVSIAGAGLCCKPEPHELAVCLQNILNMSHSERILMGEKGRELVQKNFTWDIAAQKMLTVYRCILDGKTIPENPEPAHSTNP